MMDGIFLAQTGADAKTRTDNILCDTMETCCLSRNDWPEFPSGQFGQRAAPISIPGTDSNSSKSSLLLHISSGPGPVHSLSFLRPLVAHVIGHSRDRWRANL